MAKAACSGQEEASLRVGPYSIPEEALYFAPLEASWSIHLEATSTATGEDTSLIPGVVLQADQHQYVLVPWHLWSSLQSR